MLHMILIKKEYGYRLFDVQIFGSAAEAEDYAKRCNGNKRKKDDLQVVPYNWKDFRKAAQ